jgi:class 3 adenylate cyclase
LPSGSADVKDTLVNPEIRYAKTADRTHVAYLTLGRGPIDLLIPEPFTSNLESLWHIHPWARFIERLASFARVVVFDPRGVGLSDRVSEEQVPPLESRMADIVTVMDAVGSERAALFGFDDTGPLTAITAATYPERTMALVLYNTFSSGLRRSDYPLSMTEDQWASWISDIDRRWGQQSYADDHLRLVAPSLSADEELRRAWGSWLRLGASPATAMAISRWERDTDVRHVLSAIHVPTLVLHRKGDQVNTIDEGRYLAEHIAGARFVELDGDDHVPFAGDVEGLLAELERFLRSVRDEEAEWDRILATVLFTDIVGSTETAARLGDRRWGELAQRHHAAVRAMLARFRGHEVDTAGDGFFATFDGPARGVRCARAIVEAVLPLGIQIRAGVHTGEVETIGGKVGGLAVVIGARVGALAGPSEVLATSTVKDLVVGSGLSFEDAGEYELKGVPDRWRLYRVVSG